ncbi:hypothetical protein [Streptomyces sp. NPDC001139]
MTDVEIAVGYAFAWLVGKARRVAGRADMEVDRGLDAGMDRLHELISVKLGDDPALQRAQAEAGAGLEEPSQRTRQRLELALEDAAEHDAGFAAAWSLSIDRADAFRPAGLARPMLHLASLLDANGIPETVLTSEPARAYLTVHRSPSTGSRTPLDSRPVQNRDAARALRALHQLHLIDHTP